MAQEDKSASLGEVILAGTQQFTALCARAANPDSTLPDPPAFGTLVRVGREPGAPASDLPLPEDFDPFEETPPGLPLDSGEVTTLYGVVCHAETGAMDMGRPEFERQGIYSPSFETRFSVALIACSGAEANSLRLTLPPRPPRPHAPVFPASDSEIRRLTERLDYLRPLLLGSGGPPIAYPADALVAAMLRNAWRAHGGTPDFLLSAGRNLAALLPTEYDRLRAILRQVTG